ncbi:glycoside hydrolase family 13 protein [Enterocloster lavalensis]|uniref:Alpha-glucosidase n=1 Tax=Enterocloster lavalensis TaxID=460384 RepID=A0A1I0K3K5_9FIRM|nr:glycoside hydrolase family 13 protein [Enterocloster lavalensis]PST31630.1 glycoside hydrolase family 13 protein [Enterocloster lavalensis]SEU18227.1 alpha-glucosidase [Enterocloster lavalensis]
MEEYNKRIINREALFCSATEDYRTPPEPDEDQDVLLRFRTGKNNAQHVYYVEDGAEVEIGKADSDELFDYYEYEITVGSDCVLYHFKVVNGQDSCIYNRLGVTDDDRSCFDFAIIPGFHTPDWAKGAVMYQIFVDRFCNGDESNDVQTCEYVYIGRPVNRVEDWGKNPTTMDVGCFYGGDLKGVWEKLDYIQGLGVEVIYLNPIFVSPSNHKYDIQDYEHIDPHFGVIVEDKDGLVAADAVDNGDAEKYVIRTASPRNLEASDRFFAEFVEEIHRRGMKVILDGVFNHCGSFNKWLDGEEIYARQGGYEPGAFLAKDSPYRSFFQFYDEKDSAWPRNKSYDGWWGHDTLPKLNYESSPKLVEYILDIARRWVSPPFNVDGWRLDVAADLGHTADYNHEFWRKFRAAVKEVNPDALILAEHYGDPGPWLEGDQWDSVMNYDAFMEPLTWFLTGMEKHSDSFSGELLGNGENFFNAMSYHMSRMQPSSILTAMNELSNHDHSRFLTRTNGVVGRIGTVGAEAANRGVKVCVLREAVMVQMTWPGAPTVYYGDEAGVCGWTDPDSRRTYPWGHEDLELIEYHRYMIRIHKALPVLRRGAVKELLAGRNVIAYGRMLGKYQAVVAVNNNAQERELELPVWQLGITGEVPLARLMLSTEEGYNVGALRYPVRDGMLKLKMPPYSAALFATYADEFFPVVASVEPAEREEEEN